MHRTCLVSKWAPGFSNAPHHSKENYPLLILYRSRKGRTSGRSTAFAINDEDTEWATAESTQGLGNAQAWLDAQVSEIERRTSMEVEEEQLVDQVGLHLRGSDVESTAVDIDEDSPARYYWHRQLHRFAEKGDYAASEDILLNMRSEGFIPGPKAFHALVYSYVKGGEPEGALKAIRQEANSNIRPLPQTYAAVIRGFLAIDDLDTAEALYASNKRAGVPVLKSWTALCTALFNAEEYEKAHKLLAEGETEGMMPDRKLYEVLIKTYAHQGQIDEGMKRLKEMRKNNLVPDKEHYGALVAAHALKNSIEKAEVLFLDMLKAPGPATSGTTEAINALIQMYLNQMLPFDELTEKIAFVRQTMVRAGLKLDRKGLSLLLEAAVYMDNPQIGHLTFLSLKGVHGLGSLFYVPDEVLAHFLLQLSLNQQQIELYDVLNVMSLENRVLSSPMMLELEDGRTFATAWIDFNESSSAASEVNATEDAHEQERKEWLVIDSVTLDPESLCAVDNRDRPLSPTKMTVKELRAELSARSYPLKGNKRELVKQLQRARADAANNGIPGKQKQGKSKVKRIIEEQVFIEGRLVNKLTSDEQEDDSDAEDENEEAEENDENLSLDVDEDEDGVDYDTRIDDIVQARRKIKETLPLLQESNSRNEQAIAICSATLTLGGRLSEKDLDCLIESFASSSNKSIYASKFACLMDMEEHRDLIAFQDEQIERLKSLM